MPENFLTLREAAERLKCNPETLRRAILRGDLKAGRLGEEYRIVEEDLMLFVFRKQQPQAEVK
jgi:excisionase family DNA binding protein